MGVGVVWGLFRVGLGFIQFRVVWFGVGLGWI